MKQHSKVNCRNCRYFYITWETKYPYGCRAFAMKTKQFPASQVLLSSGKECLFFSAKIKKTPPDKKNSPSSSSSDYSFEKKA